MKAKILVIEDSVTQGQRLRDSLRTFGYEVDLVSSGPEGLKQARLSPPDLVLLDVVMSDMDGFAVCRWLKLHEETRDIPVIMLTVRGEVSDRVEGLHIGADDYLPKPFDDSELDARIFAALRAKTKREELVRRNSELESMLRSVEVLAVTDALTGLNNRRRFDDALSHEFKLSRRYGTQLSCLMIDVDGFKQINDTHGHDAGDKVLRALSKLLSDTLREVDHLARFGGDEFAILMPQTGKSSAKIAADRICSQVRAHRFDGVPNGQAVTVSLGIADTGDVTGSDPEVLVRAADEALIAAKRYGRDRVVMFDGSVEQN